MSWFDAPFSEHAVLWFGIKVFWWKRILSFCQVLLGSSVLLTLLSQPQKAKMHAVLARASERAGRVRVPPLIRLRTIFRWTVPVIIMLAIVVAGVVTNSVNSVQPTRLFIMTFFFGCFVFAVAMIPVAAVATSASLLLTSFRASQRYAPLILAWLTHHQRIDRSLVIVPFLLFVIVSLVGIYLA